jgi:hypothetical protein
MASQSIGSSQPRKRTFQRKRHGAQRHAKYAGDLPIPQTLGAQIKAPAVLFGQSMNHREQPLLPPSDRPSFFGIRTRIQVDIPTLFPGLLKQLRLSAIDMTPLQTKVVRDPKNPAPQIRPRSTSPQVLKQRQENFLNHFLAIMDRQTKRQQIPKQRISQLIEKPGDFICQRAWRERAISFGALYQNGVQFADHHDVI